MRLVDAICRGQAFNVEADRLLRIHNLALPQHVEVRARSRRAAGRRPRRVCLPVPDGNFLDERRLQIVRLDLLGINILAVAQDDHFFLAPRQKQMSVRNRSSRGRRSGTIRRAALRPWRRDDSNSLSSLPRRARPIHRPAAFFLRLRVDDFSLNAFHRLAAQSRSHCRLGELTKIAAVVSVRPRACRMSMPRS